MPPAIGALSALLHADVPTIAVSFDDQVSEADLDRFTADGLDVAELRIDRYQSLAPDHVVAQARRVAEIPTIATIRPHGEGGEWTGSDADRLALFEAVLPEVDGIDIELSSTAILPAVIAAAQRLGTVVIVSHHNFEATPPADELAALAAAAKELGADFVKVSVMAHSPEDVRTLAAFTMQHSGLGLIVIAMGSHGTASRVFFPVLGSCLTYAHHGRHVVDGQLDFHETFALLARFYPSRSEVSG